MNQISNNNQQQHSFNYGLQCSKILISGYDFNAAILISSICN